MQIFIRKLIFAAYAIRYRPGICFFEHAACSWIKETGLFLELQLKIVGFRDMISFLCNKLMQSEIIFPL